MVHNDLRWLKTSWPNPALKLRKGYQLNKCSLWCLAYLYYLTFFFFIYFPLVGFSSFSRNIQLICLNRNKTIPNWLVSTNITYHSPLQWLTQLANSNIIKKRRNKKTKTKPKHNQTVKCQTRRTENSTLILRYIKWRVWFSATFLYFSLSVVLNINDDKSMNGYSTLFLFLSAAPLKLYCILHGSISNKWR